MSESPHLTRSFNLLRYSYGGVVLLAGLDKLLGTNLITEWTQYISPLAAQVFPVNAGIFLAVIGIVEIAVAIMLLTKYERLGAYLSAAWLILISFNLVLLGFIDIAIRDVLLAVGALVLAELSKAREAASLTAGIA